MAATKKTSLSEPPPIKVTVQESNKKKVTYTFKKYFTIGRDDFCEIQVMSMGVSRKHAEVLFEKGRWWIKDLHSANGTFVNGEKVNKFALGKSTKVELGATDVVLNFSVASFSSDAVTIEEKAPSITQYIQRYFKESPGEKDGFHTRLIRGAFKEVQKEQKRKYFFIIGTIALMTILIGAYSVLQYGQVQQQKELAEQLFYSMKSLELELARLENQAEQSGNEAALSAIATSRVKRDELVSSYNQLLNELNFYESSRWNERDRIILQVSRNFGECELAMPDEFLKEVYNYINRWKTTDRLETALVRAVNNSYPDIISQIMLEHHLPPQFFYLALQESDFRSRTVGPKTRYGIAKGIWQFIPATARRYGLKTGPLAGLRRYDPKDERFNFNKSTRAAAQYIRDIYETEAQASGLLVLASYNWGERKVRELIRKMPQNPQNRNFWELLKIHRRKIPSETYDYVFYIISAAVIGQNPDLFGFSFSNPLDINTAQPPDSLLSESL
jgi:soluble lytic murein transglycosylase-like protein